MADRARRPGAAGRREHPAGRTPPPRRPRATADPARQAAYEAVAAVHRDDAYANLVLPDILHRWRLTGRDAAFATELVYGTLRLRGTLDDVIAVAADRPVERIDPPVRDALRLGAYQVLHTRVPAHAAVSATVEVVRAVGPGAVGFANAVLRRVAERCWDDWLAQVAPGERDDPVGHLAVTCSHPVWIVRAFAEVLGGDLADTARLLVEDNDRPSVHLCARPGRADAVELADEVGGAPGAFSPYAVYLPGGAPGQLRAVAEGRAHVQDEGSQLVALALADAPVVGAPVADEGAAGGPSGTGPPAPSPGPAERWLDLCAGPGGKAALLGALAADRGATLTAVEVAAHRARMVERAVRGLPVTVHHVDGRDVGRDEDLPAGAFDRVLVDAPCTGLGALRRRPEARWRRRPSDLPALTRLQRELLVAGIAAARPGGLVAYVTCSPHLVETRVSLAEARRRSPYRTELVDARPYLPAGMPGLGDGPQVQLWPHRHGTDAMFLALLRRTA